MPSLDTWIFGRSLHGQHQDRQAYPKSCGGFKSQILHTRTRVCPPSLCQCPQIEPELIVMFRNSGKSPLIVFEDADLQKAAKVAAFSIVFNSGQVCMASSRVYVQKSVADEFTKLYAQAIQAVAGQAGNPLNRIIACCNAPPRPHLGPPWPLRRPARPNPVAPPSTAARPCRLRPPPAWPVYASSRV